MCTHVCGHQLLCITDAWHSDFTLADIWVIIRIGVYQKHLCNDTQNVLNIRHRASSYREFYNN